MVSVQADAKSHLHLCIVHWWDFLLYCGIIFFSLTIRWASPMYHVTRSGGSSWIHLRETEVTTHVEIDLVRCAAARISVTVTENGTMPDPVVRRPDRPVGQVVAANPSTVRQPSLFRDRKDDSR